MIKIQRFRIYDLVAVVVIGVLLVVLLQPRIAKAKPKAITSYCTAQMKQLAAMVAVYGGDNNGNCPGPQPLGTNIVAVSWDRSLMIGGGYNLDNAKIHEPVANMTLESLHKSIRSMRSIFSCPEDLQHDGGRIVPLVPGSLTDGMASGDGICRSYALNLGTGNLDGRDDGIAVNANAIPVAKVEFSADTVLLIESHGYATVFGQANIANDTTIACTREGKVRPENAFTNRLVLMHGGHIPSFNALMHDGHVERLEQAYVVANGGQIMQYGKNTEKTASPGGPAK